MKLKCICISKCFFWLIWGRFDFIWIALCWGVMIFWVLIHRPWQILSNFCKEVAKRLDFGRVKHECCLITRQERNSWNKSAFAFPNVSFDWFEEDLTLYESKVHLQLLLFHLTDLTRIWFHMKSDAFTSAIVSFDWLEEVLFLDEIYVHLHLLLFSSDWFEEDLILYEI